MQDKKKDVLVMRLLKYISFVFAGISILYLWWMWNKMPQQIPSHYNIMGVADRFGQKDGCIILVVIQCLLVGTMRGGYFLLSAVNDSAKKKTEKQERINDASQKMVTIETTFISVCFTYMIYQMVNGNNLGSWFMMVFIIGMLVPVSVYTVYAYMAGR